MSINTLTIGAAVKFHLEQTKVDANLKDGTTIITGDFPRGEFSWLERPFLKEICQIMRHGQS